jgi:hypothetical protein
MTAGCNCGRTWTGLSQAHCSSGCHAHFGSVWGFDRHRSTGRCVDPATITTGSGRCVFRKDDGPLGVTWVRADDRPHPHARARTEEVAR